MKILVYSDSGYENMVFVLYNVAEWMKNKMTLEIE